MADYHHIHPAKIIKNITFRDIEGANVVFINMPLRESAPPVVTPEGPLLLATNLRKNFGVRATIIDLNGYRIKDVAASARGLVHGRHLTYSEALELILAHFRVHGTPDIIGFSGKITTLRWQEQIASMIRVILPDVFLVSGNGLATELKMGLFQYIPELDAVARSEGDDIIIKIVHDAMVIKHMGINAALASEKLDSYYVGKINDRHRFLYEGDRPTNLDIIPFADLDLLTCDAHGNNVLENYLVNPIWGSQANNSSSTPFTMNRSTSFVSSRGCPYACAFCYRGQQGERNYGMLSAQNIANQMQEHMEKYGVDFIGMPDDNFGVDYRRIQDMVPLLQPMNVRWGTMTRLDNAAGLRPKSGKPGEYLIENPKRVELMAKAGCIYIGVGAESASPAVLATMEKGGFICQNGLEDVVVNGRAYQFPRTMIEGIKNCEYAGIHVNCTWIMAYPTETLEDLKISVAFMKWQEDFYASRGKPASSVNKRMFTATWYPGTTMIRHQKVQNILQSVFGITFNKATGEPIYDECFHRYVLELDDATKILHDPVTKQPLNFSDLPTDIFLQAREYIDSEQTDKILEM